MAHLVFNLDTLKKLAVLFRDHRLGQIANTLHFGWHALRGFPTTQLPYDPLTLVLFITARCNLRCGHCPYGNPDSPRAQLLFRDMTIECFVRILDRFPRAISIGLGGGEPLLNASLFDMIHIAHERRMKVHIPTSGTLLSTKIDDFLKAPVEFLNISLYGTDKESFSHLTGARGSLFDDTLEATAELAHRRQRGGYPRILRASFICTKRTMHEAVKFIRLCEGLGVDQVKLRNLNYFGIPGYDESMCLHEDDPEVQEFIERLRQHRFRIPVFVPRLYRCDGKPRRCHLPFRQLTVDGEGFIGPCCVVGPEKRWGNLLDQPDIWNGSTMTQARRDMLDPACPLPPTCLHCEEMIIERPHIGGKNRAESGVNVFE